MIKAIIIAAICFTIGNVIWPIMGDAKFFYIPLSALLWLLIFHVRRTAKESKVVSLLLTYILLLASGNVVKQIFYTPKIAQINDYWWGGGLTVVFGIIIIVELWQTRKRKLK